MQMILARSDSKLMSSENLWIVVRNTPPLFLPLSSSPSSLRVSTLIIVSSPTNSLAFTNCAANWSSRSVRSVINTIVGEAKWRLRINILVKNNIVILFPHPVAPKYVPPFPSPLILMCECPKMFSYSKCVAKNCG